MFKFTRTALRRRVPNSCPDKREHVKVALRMGAAPKDCRHAGVMHDPNVARWYAAPKPKHGKIASRWYGMEIGDNGKVTTRKANADELMSEIIGDGDYASKTIIWNPRIPGTLI